MGTEVKVGMESQYLKVSNVFILKKIHISISGWIFYIKSTILFLAGKQIVEVKDKKAKRWLKEGKKREKKKS